VPIPRFFEGIGPGSKSSSTYSPLFAMLATRDGLALVDAFMKIKDAKVLHFSLESQQTLVRRSLLPAR
jgi:hypothetical protein